MSRADITSSTRLAAVIGSPGRTVVGISLVVMVWVLSWFGPARRRWEW